MLLRYITKSYNCHDVTIANEAGCRGYSAARSFIEYGWDTFVVNAADISRPSKQGIIKTDKIDGKNAADDKY